MCTTTGRAGLWVTALLLTVLLAGCQKAVLYWSIGNADVDDKTCRINQITSSSGASKEYIIHYTFSYNKLGDPVSVVNDQVSTGNPNLLFVYDKYNRLVQFIRPYVNGSFESWEKYGYNNRGQIVRDTSYVLGNISADGPMDSYYITYADLLYDARNRVCKQIDSTFREGKFLFVDSFQYAYDDHGNRQLPGIQLAYDNKLNIHRTNKIWMFICRDYSVNNPFTATAYNEHCLPLIFSNNSYSNLGIMVPTGNHIEVDYNCNGDLPALPSK